MDDLRKRILEYIGMNLAQKVFELDIKEYEKSELRTADIFKWRTESILQLIEKDMTSLHKRHRLNVSVTSTSEDGRKYKWRSGKETGEIRISNDVLIKMIDGCYKKYWYDPRIEITSKGWDPSTSL